MPNVSFNPHRTKQLARSAEYVVHPSPAATASHMGMPHTIATRNGRMRFRFWYDAIIDWMLVNTDKPLKDCGKAIGRSEHTIYCIVSSDIFKHRYAQRRQEYNERLSANIGDAASGVALAALNEIKSRIDDNPAKIPTVVLNDIANKALERMGYGVAPVAPLVQINNDQRSIAVSANALLEAKASMREVHEANTRIVSVEEPSRISRREEPDLEDIL